MTRNCVRVSDEDLPYLTAGWKDEERKVDEPTMDGGAGRVSQGRKYKSDSRTNGRGRSGHLPTLQSAYQAGYGDCRCRPLQGQREFCVHARFLHPGAPARGDKSPGLNRNPELMPVSHGFRTGIARSEATKQASRSTGLGL